MVLAGGGGERKLESPPVNWEEKNSNSPRLWRGPFVYRGNYGNAKVAIYGMSFFFRSRSLSLSFLNSLPSPMRPFTRLAKSWIEEPNAA